MRKILIVEDEQRMCAMLEQFLQRKGYPVIFAADGADALSKLDAHSGEIGCVVTDHDMPNMTGMQLLERMRNDQRHRSIPVILGSARALEDDDLRVAAEARGARVILKPYRLNTLMEEIRIVFVES